MTVYCAVTNFSVIRVETSTLLNVTYNVVKPLPPPKKNLKLLQKSVVRTKHAYYDYGGFVPARRAVIRHESFSLRTKLSNELQTN